MQKTEIQAVQMVRRIRDEQVQLWAGKGEAEVLDFFRKAGEAAREDARRRTAAGTPRRQGV